MPALGMAAMGTGERRESRPRCRFISRGPVAQLRPIRSGFSGARAARAAEGSVPSSMAPDSSMVTEVSTGTRRPAAAKARRTPCTAARVCSRSWQVSTDSRSTPPSSSPAACSS